MRSSTVLPLALTAQALAQNASPVTGNPLGVAYKATLPELPFFKGAGNNNIKGSIMATAGPDGKGVTFSVEFDNILKEGGPFSFHIHETAAINGNCTSTKAHLDPFGRGQKPPCDSSAVETCEVGDLSGKYGKLEGPVKKEFTDAFASLQPGTAAFIGDKSIVIHYANTTRLTCANFELIADAIPVPAEDCNTHTPSKVVTPPTDVPVYPPVESQTSAVPPVYPPVESQTSVVPPVYPPVQTSVVPTYTPTPSPTPPPVGAASAVHFSVPLMVAGFAAIFFAL